MRIAIFAVLLGAATGGQYIVVAANLREQAIPLVASVDLRAAFIDESPMTVTVTLGGTHVTVCTTVNAVRLDVTLWRRMHLSNWNGVAPALREAGLRNMLYRYRRLLARPDVWDRMSARDWDLVPQPVRVVAFRRMAAYWAGFYNLGDRFSLPSKSVADTLAAIIMSESWFDHRGVLINPDGSADIGLAGASEFARRRLRELLEAGTVYVAFEDQDYYDPWKATRFAAIWLSLLLDDAAGSLETAVRAYNRGAANAYDARGTAYYRTVQQRLSRFIRNHDAPPAWAFVSEHASAYAPRP